ncbi:hypothetical protein KA005_41145 [bacterium]|nr:hypothetical protein [bacterium]
MNYQEALQTLGIEDYAERIFASNSHGELFHLAQYIRLAEHFGKTDWFSEWFESVVKEAEETWERPQSVFQHILDILIQNIE